MTVSLCNFAFNSPILRNRRGFWNSLASEFALNEKVKGTFMEKELEQQYTRVEEQSSDMEDSD